MNYSRIFSIYLDYYTFNVTNNVLLKNWCPFAVKLVVLEDHLMLFFDFFNYKHLNNLK